MSNINTDEPRIDSTAALARHLGLSRWTVSRVLNDHPGVKEATRERVHKAMAELGFQPNQLARGLRGAASRLVGICFQQLEAPILARKTSTLQTHLRAQGYRGVLEMTDGDRHLEATIVRHFQSIGVDGIVLVGSTLCEDDTAVEQLLRAGKPVIAVDPVHELPFPQVMLDRRAAMEQVVGHLYDLGHRRFALLGFDSDQLYPVYRREGLLRAAQAHGLDLEADFCSLSASGYMDQDYSYGALLAEQYLDLPQPRPSALIALNDRLAIGAMRVLQEAGLGIPRDVSVLGFDNIEASAWIRPGLTTVDQRIDHCMSEATSLLVQAIQQTGEGHPARRRVEPGLVARESTGPAPVQR